MRIVACAAVAIVVLTAGQGTAAAQNRQDAGQRRNTAAPAPDNIGEAYDQFLLAQRFESDDNVDAAVTAYKKAITLDPKSADVVAALANLYLRANRADDAAASAQQALAIDGKNREAHRILGTIYAEMALAARAGSGRGQRGDLTTAIQHFESALENPVGEPDVNVRAMLARLYITSGEYAKAIPLLTELVKEEPQWQDGATLLAEAYSASGRSDEAVAWLEGAVDENPQLFATLADFYSRQRRYKEAAATYERAISVQPRSVDLRVRYGQVLLSAGGTENANRARDLLRETANAGSTDERVMYLLSEAERLSGHPEDAEIAARRLITANKKSARGYLALAEALEERQRYQALADSLGPAVAEFRSGTNAGAALSSLLPHLGFAYQELGQFDKAISSFEEARKLAPEDQRVTSYLIQAFIAAKKYTEAAELAHTERASHPDDLRLARLEARALRESGKTDQGLTVLTDLVSRHQDLPPAYIALAQYYSDANRGAQAVKVLQDGQTRFPDDATFTFELGAVLDKQKRYAESEALFRQLVSRDPDNAAALNYLGYMLAQRGERLDESVDFVQRALKLEPENGAYLDSLGWAYYKSGKLDLALDNLARAAEHLATNSVIQDHFGDALFKAGRYDEAVAAWMRALAGDLESVDRGDIDKKIKSARQKLPKK